MRILIFSDSHFHNTHRFSHITSEGFTVRELEQYNCVEDILKIAHEEGVHKIIFAGDFFGPVGDNVSAQTLTILSLFIGKIIDKYQFDIVVGNHDQCVVTPDYNIHKLEIFKHWPNIKVYDTPTIDGNIIYMPYSYSDEYTEAFLNSIKDKNDKIIISHLELKDIPLGNGIFSKHGVSLNTLKQFKAVFQGHYHSICNYAKNIHIIGSMQRTSFKDQGSSRNNIIIYDTETNKISRRSFTSPDWLTFTDENINDILKTDSNNYVRLELSTDILITPEIQKKLETFKGKDIHVDVTRISINKDIMDESSNGLVMSEADVLQKFIIESDNSDKEKEDLLVEGKRLLDISK